MAKAVNVTTTRRTTRTRKPTIPVSGISKTVVLTPEMKAHIEERLLRSNGGTWQEFGIDLAMRFGEIKDLERKRDELSRGAGNIMTHPNLEEIAVIESQMKNREFRMALAAKYGKAAKDYVIETYGAEHKDGNGYVTGYGERIVFNHRDGHVRRVW